jgi:hypothetical protein
VQRFDASYAMIRFRSGATAYDWRAPIQKSGVIVFTGGIASLMLCKPPAAPAAPAPHRRRATLASCLGASAASLTTHGVAVGVGDENTGGDGAGVAVTTAGGVSEGVGVGEATGESVSVGGSGATVAPR